MDKGILAGLTALVGTVAFLALTLSAERITAYPVGVVGAALVLLTVGFYAMACRLQSGPSDASTAEINLYPEFFQEEFDEEYEPPYEEEDENLSSIDPNYQEAFAGHQYHGGYGSSLKQEQKEPYQTMETGHWGMGAGSRGHQGAPVTAAPTCSLGQQPVGFGGEGVPSSSCSAKRGGRPFYMFGVGM